MTRIALFSDVHGNAHALTIRTGLRA